MVWRAGRAAPHTPGLQGQHPGASEMFPGEGGRRGRQRTPGLRHESLPLGAATVAGRLSFAHPGGLCPGPLLRPSGSQSEALCC